LGGIIPAVAVVVEALVAEGGFGAEAVDVVVHPATTIVISGAEGFAEGIVAVGGGEIAICCDEGGDVAVAIVEGVAGAGITCFWNAGDGE
jgi:hypothetical protein